MSASNDNWVCFKCRSALRYPKTAEDVPKCRVCDSITFWLGYKVEIPKKNDVRGWRKLEEDCRARELVRVREEAFEKRRQARAAKSRIEELEALPPNKDRDKLIAQLRKDLDPGPWPSPRIPFTADRA